jgi:hypothetical protein
MQRGHINDTSQSLGARERAVPLKREAVGFALVPLPVVAPFTLLFGVIVLDRPSDSASVIEAWFQIVFASYCVALLVGVPSHFALRRLGRSSLRSYLGAATLGVAAIAVATGLLQIVLPASPERNPHGMTLASASGLAGMLIFEGFALIGAWIFWRVSIRPRSEQMPTFGSSTGI